MKLKYFAAKLIDLMFVYVLCSYIPMIYASRNWFYDNLNMNELNQFDIWLAQYNDVADYTGHYEIWQHTSKGTILGISGNVDLNIGYKIY